MPTDTPVQVQFFGPTAAAALSRSRLTAPAAEGTILESGPYHTRSIKGGVKVLTIYVPSDSDSDTEEEPAPVVTVASEPQVFSRPLLAFPIDICNPLEPHWQQVILIDPGANTATVLDRHYLLW